ncbi:hypothetical protein PV797_15120 [Clostridiaceae bacterium M8S5]|nr:hypothetical protein PV797_15120 [Clostridiaceae bacterium M8S5]
MKKQFVSSLCHIGAHGGMILLSNEFLVYKTQKLVLSDNYRNIKILYSDIKYIRRCRSLLVFPAVIINLKDGLHYKFIVFNRKQFLKILNNKCIRIL